MKGSSFLGSPAVECILLVLSLCFSLAACLAFINKANTVIFDTDLSLFSFRSILWCNHQLLHPRAHVWLLWPGSLGTSGAEVPLVEEIPHHYSDGGFYLRITVLCISCGCFKKNADMCVVMLQLKACHFDKRNIFVQMLKYLVKCPYKTNLFALSK